MAGTPGKFPNTDLAGTAIPFDLLFPLGAGVVDFTGVVSAAIPLPTNATILSVRATANCYIRFGATPAAVPASGLFTNSTLFVAIDEVINLVTADTSFTVIGETGPGKLYIQVSQPWTDLRPNNNLNRI